MTSTDDTGRPSESIEAEVLGNILAQPIIAQAADAATVADLNLPASFTARIADRVIRSSFEDRHRVIYNDRAQHAAAPHDAPQLTQETWPELRGYRPPLIPDDPEWPHAFPSSGDSLLRLAAEHVARRLAFDGFPATFTHIRNLLAPLLPETHDPEGPMTDLKGAGSRADAHVSLFRRAGLPTDLLRFFSLDHPSEFNFRPTIPGFRAIDDAGSENASLVRMQMTRPDHWIQSAGGGPGSGDNVDLLLHLLRAAPDLPFVISIHHEHADVLRLMLARADIAIDRVTILPVPHPVSQWAQDNLKTGAVGTTSAALFPRFASRAEDGAKMDASDTAALARVSVPGLVTAHSPLHFQGGNLMLLRRGETRILLIGEAEIARNAALGLTPAQSETALRAEMGADVSVVLPAAGFHLDTEILPRCIGKELIVFVADEPSAARIILRTALQSLETARVLSRADARPLHAFLDHRNDEQVVARFSALLSQVMTPSGEFPASFAEVFRAAAWEFPPANAQRVLLAIDILAGLQPRPWEHSLHPHAQAYFRSLRRLADDRRELTARLSPHGIRIVPVPALAADRRSASVINAVNLRDRLLVPVRNGFFKPLDDAAIRVIRQHVPPSVRIVPIPAAESERRGGAVHCSVSLFPAPPSARSSV